MSYEKERAIAEAATSGPWSVEALPDGQFGKDWKSIWSGLTPIVMHDSWTRQEFGEASCHHGVEISAANASYIATFNPQFVLGLIDRVERYEAALRRISETDTYGQADYIAGEALNPTKANDD